jgi:hypothetical protein
MVYKPFRLNLSKNQALNAVKSKPIRVKYDQMNVGPHTILLHPMTYKALVAAYNKHKGITFILSPGEIHATKASDLEGTGIFDFFKKGFNWVKNHWGDIKKVLTPVIDLALPAVAAAAGPYAPAVIGGRQLLKATTGASISAKRPKKSKGKKIDSSAGLYLSSDGNGLYL